MINSLWSINVCFYHLRFQIPVIVSHVIKQTYRPIDTQTMHVAQNTDTIPDNTRAVFAPDVTNYSRLFP